MQGFVTILVILWIFHYFATNMGEKISKEILLKSGDLYFTGFYVQVKQPVQILFLPEINLSWS